MASVDSAFEPVVQRREVADPVALAEVREGQPGHRLSELPHHLFQRSDPVVLQGPESRKNSVPVDLLSRSR